MKKIIVSVLLMAALTAPAIASAERTQRNDNPQEKNRQETKREEQQHTGNRNQGVRQETQHQGVQRQGIRNQETRHPEYRQQNEANRPSFHQQNIQNRDNFHREDRDTQLRYSGNREQNNFRENNHRDNGWQRDNHTPDRDWRSEGHSWSHPVYHTDYWRNTNYSYYRNPAFRWHQNYSWFSGRYRMDRVYDDGWCSRFPGLRVFRWHDRDDAGFWYHGHRIYDAMMFYNDGDELVSIGFFFDGVFILLRDDYSGYENHDSFFASWWGRNGGISIRL